MTPAELFDLSGRTALVTGASRGIGRTMARTLADAGAEVILAARSGPALEEVAAGITAKGGRARALILDVCDETAVTASLASLRDVGSAPNILVNNAGIIERTPLAESQTDAWRNVVDTNLVAPYVLAREAARGMVAAGFGRIVNIASIMALHGKRNAHAYVSTKHAIAGLTKALAAELGPSGVTTNAICPGYIRTEINVALQTDPAFNASVSTRTPVGRWGETSDLATALLFLCAPASAYVNGHLLVVDGGFTVTH
jgi:gluconate 5-dehydrogenase